jgi:hypothetical protein
VPFGWFDGSSRRQTGPLLVDVEPDWGDLLPSPCRRLAGFTILRGVSWLSPTVAGNNSADLERFKEVALDRTACHK